MSAVGARIDDGPAGGRGDNNDDTGRTRNVCATESSEHVIDSCRKLLARFEEARNLEHSGTEESDDNESFDDAKRRGSHRSLVESFTETEIDLVFRMLRNGIPRQLHRDLDPLPKTTTTRVTLLKALLASPRFFLRAIVEVVKDVLLLAQHPHRLAAAASSTPASVAAVVGRREAEEIVSELSLALSERVMQRLLDDDMKPVATTTRSHRRNRRQGQRDVGSGGGGGGGGGGNNGSDRDQVQFTELANTAHRICNSTVLLLQEHGRTRGTDGCDIASVPKRHHERLSASNIVALDLLPALFFALRNLRDLRARRQRRQRQRRRQRQSPAGRAFSTHHWRCPAETTTTLEPVLGHADSWRV